MKGFLVVVENNNFDYLEMAYLLARSIDKTQSKYKKMSIITSDMTPISEKHKKVFDKIIVLPEDKTFKKRSKSTDTTSMCASYYENTPYSETIVLDADFLFTSDIKDWWRLFKNDLVFTTTVKTYKNIDINNDHYRTVFTENKLPNIYTGLFYFKKSKKTKIFFKLVNDIFDKWEEYFKILENPPKFLSADVAYAMAYKLLEYPVVVSSFPTFVHMKTRLQNIDEIEEDWTKFLSVTYCKGDLKINNFLQTLPFHYTDKSFLNIVKDKFE